jgi:outer membrane usher protein FimD/PapC
MKHKRDLLRHLNGKRTKSAFMSTKASNGSKLPAGKKRFEAKKHAAYVAEKMALAGK